MKNRRQMLQSRQVHILFAVIIILLVFSYTGSVIFINGLDSALLGLSAVFILCMIGVGALWILLLRRQITALMENVDEMVEGAIHGREPLTSYEETSLSAAEHKLLRYIEMSKANESSIKMEKNKIKVLISDISHQTKTPLSNIVLYSQLLEETPGLEEDTRQCVDHIRTQSNKLNWLIQSLIKLSRLETGMISLQLAEHSLVPTVQRAVAQIHAGAESKDIGVSISCDPGIAAKHDVKWTSEALFNVLENAVKYTEPGGTIHLSAQSNEMFTRIDISDTGIGIAQEELHPIFKRFYRGQNIREAEGVGIGLFLAREIITAQGGHIQATSELHKGSVFSVFLPRI